MKQDLPKYILHSKSELIELAQKIVKYLNHLENDRVLTFLQLMDEVFTFQGNKYSDGHETPTFSNGVYLASGYNIEDEAKEHFISEKTELLNLLIGIARSSKIFIEVKNTNMHWKHDEPLSYSPLLRIRKPKTI